MENESTPNGKNRRKAALVAVMALSLVLVIVFWMTIRLFQIKGLPLYLMQLGLYLTLFMLGWWGARQEQAALPLNGRRIREALIWLLAGCSSWCRSS